MEQNTTLPDLRARILNSLKDHYVFLFKNEDIEKIFINGYRGLNTYTNAELFIMYADIFGLYALVDVLGQYNQAELNNLPLHKI